MHTENHILPVDDGGEHLSKKAFVHLFLFAWYESITHQHERVPLLAATVGVPPAEMLSHSIVPSADSVQGGRRFVEPNGTLSSMVLAMAACFILRMDAL